MIISVASGKGGTGKTTFATNFARALDQDVQFLDCDVEEPNAHIFLKPEITKKEFVSTPVPVVDDAQCDYCGVCARICAYNALAVLKSKVLIFPHLCHGCGGCRLLCPQHAITEDDRKIGVVEMGTSGSLQFVHGTLTVGEVMSPPVIRAVKKRIDPHKIVIIDAPPGTSCPVIEAIKGSDICLLVTEPTPFGLHDLVLAVEVVRKLNMPCGIIINRADIGDDKVEAYCTQENIPVLMRIPFDQGIAKMYSNGTLLVSERTEYVDQFRSVFTNIQRMVHESKTNRRNSHAVYGQKRNTHSAG
ncbi:(4Fe-4S)-binding protein [candidate division WOR_3 bacterium SM23_60]|uniref:(4Fe-4S)-binding protein n=1 Tax=candidate division WOR_3 bacterium SM23_60 TaxID=1703780 RepID=A0A0S8G930_UNCW3|nr:MAG: (4Fe-4S)-binding protein [candidate division WOR_3 bacterium SM23_60]